MGVYSEKAELHSQNAIALSPSAFKNSVDCMASRYIRIVANFVLGGGGGGGGVTVVCIKHPVS